MTSELEQERESQLEAYAAHAAVQQELERTQRHQSQLEAKLLALTNQMAEFMNRQTMSEIPSASSSMPPPAAEPNQLPQPSTSGNDLPDQNLSDPDTPLDQYDVWNRRSNQQEHFHDAQSMTDSVNSIDKTWVEVTGDEA